MLAINTDDLAIDTCGTGGDGFVPLAFYGGLDRCRGWVPVFKHGNRSVSVSAEVHVLEELESESIFAQTREGMCSQVNIGFLLAPFIKQWGRGQPRRAWS